MRFDLGEGQVLSLARDDPQLRHIDHAWSSTVHAAQGMTRDAAIGVLDTGHGQLNGQARLYVEASRARDRFVLVTDDRERLEEVLEENDGFRMTALEAVGDDDAPPGAPSASIGMLRRYRDDWRALAARAEAENAKLSRMDGYGRIVTGVEALAEGMDLPPDLAAFVTEVRRWDAEIVARRRQELTFVQRAEMHGRQWPLVKWAAEGRGRPLSDLPEHAAWLAEGRALAETGCRLKESAGEGFAGRIAAALRRILQSVGRDEAEARAAVIHPRDMAGAEERAERAQAVRDPGLPGSVRPKVEAWTTQGETHAPAPDVSHPHRPQHPDLEEAGRRIESFLRDCRDHLDEETAIALSGDGLASAGTLEPDALMDRTEALRREGLRLLGEGEGAKLADPARIRLTRVTEKRIRVREAVDALGEEAQRLRADAFMEARRRVERQQSEAGADPVDLPAWEPLRARADELRGEPGLAPEVKEGVDAVLARDARIEVEIAPIETFLDEGARHLERRARLEEEARELGGEVSGLDAMPAWRDRSQKLRDTARVLLGEAEGDAGEMRAGARLADMPRLQGRVRGVLDRLETVGLGDDVADFHSVANAVEARAGQERTLPLQVEGYDRAMAMAEGLAKREILPDEVRHQVGRWLERDRGWKAELASVGELTGVDRRRMLTPHSHAISTH